MKYILATLLALSISTPALADGRRHNGYNNHNRPVYVQHHRHHNDKWVVPLIGGVILGAVINEASKPKETVVVEKVVKQKCEPITVIVEDQWGRVIEKRREERCVTVY